MLITNFLEYTKVSFPRIRYAYNKCIPKFDFLDKVYQILISLITNVYQSLIS